MTRAIAAAVVTGALLVAVGAVGLLRHPGGSAPAARSLPLVNVGRLPSPSPPSSESVPARDRPSPGTPPPPGARLRIARLGVDAPVHRSGADGHVLEVPRDPRDVGWWTGGAAPGASTGTVVVVGHVNYAGVRGALGVIGRAHPGDRVVLGAGREPIRYRVIAVRSYAKSAGLPADLFVRTGPPRLVLITCGGTFDAASGNYEANVVAYAVPV